MKNMLCIQYKVERPTSRNRSQRQTHRHYEECRLSGFWILKSAWLKMPFFLNVTLRRWVAQNYSGVTSELC